MNSEVQNHDEPCSDQEGDHDEMDQETPFHSSYGAFTGAQSASKSTMPKREKVDVLETALEDLYTAISFKKPIKQKDLVHAVWFGSEGLARIERPKGKFIQTMGQNQKSSTLLSPEEILFLLERGILSLEDEQGNVMDVQDGFTNFIGSDAHRQCTLEEYQVYGHLKRLGFVVFLDRNSVADSVQDHEQKVLTNLDTITWMARWQRNTNPLWKTHVPLGLCWKRILERQLPIYSQVTQAEPTIPTRFFRVYKPNAAFRKSKPGPPDYTIVVARFQDNPLDILQSMGNVSHIAVVEGWALNFYRVY